MKFRCKGLKEYCATLESLSNVFAMEYAVELALKKGADVVADETKKALESLDVDNRNYVPDGRRALLQVQKNGLIESFGITPTQNKKNLIDIKTGFDGYNKIGQPNVWIARRLESGTSYMPKNPVISRATKKARSGCLEAMQDSLNDSIEKMKKKKGAN